MPTHRTSWLAPTLVALAVTNAAVTVKGADAVPLAVQPFPLTAVRLLDGPFAEAQQRNRDVLLALEPDRLLHMFCMMAGLPSEAQPYGGWEAPEVEVRGHSLGHYLSACALTYASTGDVRFQDRTRHIVEVLAACQKALASQATHPGYLAAFPESFFDRVETRQPVWVPWYTMHKVMAGLLDTYQYCDDQQALDVLLQIAEWVRFRVDRLSLEQQQAMLETEYGGMNEVLANLYAVTGNAEHLRLAKVFDHRRLFDPLAQGQDCLDGLHANTQIPKMIGAAREYQVTADTHYLDIAKCFWESVALRRSYVIGGHSDSEHFFPPVTFGKHLTPETAETCNTYNMLKLTRNLFMVEPSATLMDFYERALYNHILASQDPERGMFVYLMSLKPGHFKSYSTLDNSFWCCFGTGMENHAKYGDTIFAHGDDALYVNLFIPAELQWKEQGLVVRQETRFPEEETTRLRFEVTSPKELTLCVRHPAWTDGIRILVNGQPQTFSLTSGSYAAVRRTWRSGDVVEIGLPLSLRVEQLPHAPEWAALLYGPIVLAGDLGTEGLKTVDLYTRSQVDLVSVPGPEVPVLVCEPTLLPDHVTPVAGKPLTFQTQGIGRPQDVTLQPFYRTHYRRYSVYWECRSEAQWREIAAARAAAEAERQKLEARTVDTVVIGQSDSEQQHELQGERTGSGPYGNRAWRHATDGGWFSYQLKVLPDQPMTLQCTYWGSDAGNRQFDVLVDGTQIATQQLERNKPDEFFDVQYALPADLTRGKTSVTVRFQGHPGNFAGGVFGLRMIQ
jgi:uncharacterized protein